MNLLHKFFFPGLPYPQAIIWHIILGGTVAAIIGYFGWGYHGNGYALPIIGGIVAIILGYVVALIAKRNP